MNKTMEEWIALYEKKTGEKFEHDKRFVLFYLPEKGFCEVADIGEMLMANQMCGEFKFWRAFVEDLSRKFGYKKVGTICIRHIKPYIRMAGFAPYSIEKTSQGDRFFCKDKYTGQKGQASPAGKNTYYITWEVAASV